MAKDCWYNKNSGNDECNGGRKPRWNKFKGKCNHCGKVGHKKADCREKFPDTVRNRRNLRRKTLRKSEPCSAEA